MPVGFGVRLGSFFSRAWLTSEESHSRPHYSQWGLCLGFYCEHVLNLDLGKMANFTGEEHRDKKTLPSYLLL